MRRLLKLCVEGEREGGGGLRMRRLRKLFLLNRAIALNLCHSLG